MAFMSKERKETLVSLVRKAIPADWKWSVRVRNHSTIVLTIRQAPIDLLQDLRDNGVELDATVQHFTLNPYHYKNYMSPELGKVFDEIFTALNTGNHNNSDAMTDYFDVGWYVDVQIGEWDNPFLHAIKPSAHDKYLKKVSGMVQNHKTKKLIPKGKVFGTGANDVSDKVKKKGIKMYQLDKYLPLGWEHFTPGKKAAATKKAMKMAGFA
jgi:hypothetical protein